MGTNFSFGKKPKNEEPEIKDELNEEEATDNLDTMSEVPDDLDQDIEVEEDESLNSSSSSSDSSDMKKRLVLIMGIIFIGLLLLMLILYVASLFSHKSYTYENIEEMMKNAAISYFNDYPDQLPSVEGNIVEIDSVNLIAAGKMKDFSEYRSDGASCSGSVQVLKTDTEYVYVPYLNCGEAYFSTELHTKVVEDNPVVSSGDGLYATGGNYVFRGEIVNNYVKLENDLWRIVKITSDGSIMLINANGIRINQPWDDRYNETRQFTSGINNYSVSRMKDYLQKVYTTPDVNNAEEIIGDKDKLRMMEFTLCIGSRSDDGTSKNNSEECQKKIPNQKMGLLTVSDYVYASLDNNCKKITDRSCTNYNYLVIKSEWWLVTPNSKQSSLVYKVDRNGMVKADTASTYATVRPVIYINNRTMTNGGKGTLEDPYIVK